MSDRGPREGMIVSETFNHAAIRYSMLNMRCGSHLIFRRSIKIPMSYYVCFINVIRRCHATKTSRLVWILSTGTTSSLGERRRTI